MTIGGRTFHQLRPRNAPDQCVGVDPDVYPYLEDAFLTNQPCHYFEGQSILLIPADD